MSRARRHAEHAAETVGHYSRPILAAIIVVFVALQLTPIGMSPHVTGPAFVVAAAVMACRMAAHKRLSCGVCLPQHAAVLAALVNDGPDPAGRHRRFLPLYHAAAARIELLWWVAVLVILAMSVAEQTILSETAAHLIVTFVVALPAAAMMVADHLHDRLLIRCESCDDGSDEEDGGCGVMCAAGSGT